jgi:hypothetical protein
MNVNSILIRVLRNCSVAGAVLYADYHVTGVLPSMAVRAATLALPAQADWATRVLRLATRAGCSSNTMTQLGQSQTIDAVVAQLARALEAPAGDGGARVRSLLQLLDQCANSPLTHAAIVRTRIVGRLCDDEPRLRSGGVDLHALSSLLAKLSASDVFGEVTQRELYTTNGALRCCSRLCAATPDVFVQERVALTLRHLAQAKSLQQRMLDDGVLAVLADIAARGDVESGAHVVAALASLADGPERRDVALALAGSDLWLTCLRRWALLKQHSDVRLHAAETLAHILHAAPDDATVVSVLRRVGVDVFESLVSSVDSFGFQTVVERCLARLQAQSRNVDTSNEVYVVDASFTTRRRQIKVS